MRRFKIPGGEAARSARRRAFVFIPFFTLCYFAVGIMLMLLSPSMGSVLTSILADSMLLVLSGAYYVEHHRGRRVPLFRFGLDATGRDRARTVFNAALFVFVAWYGMQVLSGVFLSAVDDAGMTARTEAIQASPEAYVVLAVFLAPLTEELFMRGVVMNLISGGWGLMPGILMSSLAFAALHGAVVYMYFGLVMGVMLSLIYVATGRLRHSMLAHCALNVTALFLDAPVIDNPVAFVLTVAANAVIVLMVFRALVRFCRLSAGFRDIPGT